MKKIDKIVKSVDQYNDSIKKVAWIHIPAALAAVGITGAGIAGVGWSTIATVGVTVLTFAGIASNQYLSSAKENLKTIHDDIKKAVDTVELQKTEEGAAISKSDERILNNFLEKTKVLNTKIDKLLQEADKPIPTGKTTSKEESVEREKLLRARAILFQDFISTYYSYSEARQSILTLLETKQGILSGIGSFFQMIGGTMGAAGNRWNYFFRVTNAFGVPLSSFVDGLKIQNNAILEALKSLQEQKQDLPEHALKAPDPSKSKEEQIAGIKI
jgi:hypothetical protein